MSRVMTLQRPARRYLRTPAGQHSKGLVRRFHGWLTKWGLSLDKLRRVHIESFLQEEYQRPVTPQTKAIYRGLLVRYLEWLYAEAYLLFNPKCFRPKEIFLPEPAKTFVRYLNATHKKRTVSGYRGTLRAFHQWLEHHDLSLQTIERPHMTHWFSELKETGTSASCRANKIIQIRMYFLWLNEEGLLDTRAFFLVRNRDIPKLPHYLPRPFPPEADRILQERLQNSDSMYQQGLLLMRKTGIRIGELRDLEQNCTFSDHKGNHFLKVPLGKLDNERLVPLDTTALHLVHKLQSINHRPQKRWLLETVDGQKTRYAPYREAIQLACQGLEINGKATSHRLRHTYATTLLNAGMSLLAVMKLLGHRSFRMTLRYAAVTQETIRKEFFNALNQIEQRYTSAFQHNHTNPTTDPVKMLSDIIRWLKNNAAHAPKTKQHAAILIKRIIRLQLAIQKLMNKF